MLVAFPDPPIRRNEPGGSRCSKPDTDGMHLDIGLALQRRIISVELVDFGIGRITGDRFALPPFEDLVCFLWKSASATRDL